MASSCIVPPEAELTSRGSPSTVAVSDVTTSAISESLLILIIFCGRTADDCSGKVATDPDFAAVGLKHETLAAAGSALGTAGADLAAVGVTGTALAAVGEEDDACGCSVAAISSKFAISFFSSRCSSLLAKMPPDADK